MKAPDKVYVKKEKNNVIYSLSVQYDNGGEVYVHKDALIKWLDGKMTIEGATEGFIGGYDTALKDVIDKLNSM